ncbi:MAG: ABC transporter ATP-binding protein [Deltaproteobacteria bacterium]|nr:MAG: ABC transporter ATP-binding protein [Deltaproteobacteria bacterium]
MDAPGGEAGGPLIALDGIGVTLGSSPILADVSLSVDPGERLAIVGHNGAGKSTLLDVMLGLRPIDAGTLSVLDQAPPAKGVGFVPQEPGASLLPWYTMRRNIVLPLLARGDSGSACDRALAEVQGRLDPERTLDLDARPENLSGGQRQLGALMRALIAEPRLLLCDEPFSALDPGARARMRERLRSACEAPGGPALVLVTHDIEDMLSLVDRVVVLSGRPATIAHSIDSGGASARADIERALAS